MSIEPQTWRPATYVQAETDIAAMSIRETHVLELKEKFANSAEGRGKLVKALASMGNHGGTIVVGVVEDRTTGCAGRLAPLPVAGEVDRVMALAAALDPPLAIPTPAVLEDPDDHGRGILVITVPASPMAPHRTPDGAYFARDTRAYPMPDADVERYMRLRHDRGTAARAAMAVFMRTNDPLHAPTNVDSVPAWYAITIDPNPSHLPFLLRSRLATEEARAWLEQHRESAAANVQALLAGSPHLAGVVPNNWSPFYRQPWPVRIDGGVRFLSVGENVRAGFPPMLGVIEVLESGAIRLGQNYLTYESDPDTVHWPDVLGATAWTMGLFRSIHDEAGIAAGANVAVRVGRIENRTASAASAELQERRRRGFWNPDPYPADGYAADRGLTWLELSGDVAPALDWLWGQFLRNLSLPDLLNPALRPPTQQIRRDEPAAEVQPVR